MNNRTSNRPDTDLGGFIRSAPAKTKAQKQPNPLNLEIGQRIKNIRETSHVTQEQLAETISVSSKQYISDLERGVVGASVQTIIKICVALHASADYILMGVNSEETPCPESARMLQELPAEQRQMIDKSLCILLKSFEYKKQAP